MRVGKGLSFRGTAMLLFNLTALSDAQIHKMIWARCKAFGRVEGVSIHRRSTARPGAFALVDMASSAEVRKVIKGIGDVLSGAEGVVVPLGGPYLTGPDRPIGAALDNASE